MADQFKLLEWILEQEIILTGDICEDVKPDYVLMIYFIQWLKHCELHDSLNARIEKIHQCLSNSDKEE